MVYFDLLSFAGLLHQILKEVQTSNQMLQMKVTELEDKVNDMKGDRSSTQRNSKVLPSREVRVSMV